ncbi:hypothetical protein L9F63_022031, partial [Diploptera punctata]
GRMFGRIRQQNAFSAEQVGTDGNRYFDHVFDVFQTKITEVVLSLRILGNSLPILRKPIAHVIQNGHLTTDNHTTNQMSV